KRFGVSFLLLVFSIVAVAQSEADLDEGRKLLAEGRFTEAAAAFHRHKQSFPSDARAYFHAGLALAEAGRWNEAALELHEAVRLDPRHVETRILQASVFARLRQNQAAIETLATVVKSNAVERLDANWLWRFSDVYYRLERFDDALRALDLLEKRAPGDPRLDQNRGQVYVVKGNFDLALQAFKKCIEKLPKNAPAYFELGKIYYQRNELEASQKALREAVRLDPDQPEYFLKLGQVCLALGQTEEAIERLTRVERLDPALSQTYYALGSAYHQQGNQTKSAEYRRKYQEISAEQRKKQKLEEDVSRLISQGEKQLDQGDEAAARNLFEQAVRLDPKNWDANGYLVEMILPTAEWRRAYPYLVKMGESEPDSAVGNYLMARYWYQSKEFEKALVYAEKVKLVRPGHAE